MNDTEVMLLEELDKKIQRMENQIAALRQANLILLSHLATVAQGQKLSPEAMEVLRGQYRAVTSIVIPKN